MTPTHLKGASEILGRLADAINSAPKGTKRVKIPIDKIYYSALQELLCKTEWDNRFCWEFGNPTNLSVDISPLPIKLVCKSCSGLGFVLSKKEIL